MAKTIEIPDGFDVHMLGIRSGDVDITVHVHSTGEAWGYVHISEESEPLLCEDGPSYVSLDEALALCADVKAKRDAATLAVIGPVGIDADGRPVCTGCGTDEAI